MSQVISVLPAVLPDVRWPNLFEEIADGFSFVNLDFASEPDNKILLLEASGETAASSSSSVTVGGGTISSENNAEGKPKKHKLSLIMRK